MQTHGHIDTHAMAKLLLAAGYTDEQTEAQIEVVNIVVGHLVTKRDLKEEAKDLRRDIEDVRTDMQTLLLKHTLAVGGMLVVAVGLTLSGVSFLLSHL